MKKNKEALKDPKVSMTIDEYMDSVYGKKGNFLRDKIDAKIKSIQKQLAFEAYLKKLKIKSKNKGNELY